MKSIAISVIAPAYNVEKYILECLSSLKEQTFDSYEIIVVNDGSTDRTLEVINDFVKANESLNIVVITQPNAGLSAARNTGIAAARGEYLLFVDSDDWIEGASSLREFYDLAKSGNADMVICDFESVYEKRSVFINGMDTASGVIVSGEEVLRKMLVGTVPISACNKLVRHALIKKVAFNFPVGMWYEDVSMYRLMLPDIVVVRLEGARYKYRQREGSITKSFSEKLWHKYEVSQELKGYLQKNNLYQQYKQEFDFFFLKSVLLATVINACTYGTSHDEKNRRALIKRLMDLPETKAYQALYQENKYLKGEDKYAVSLLFRNWKLFRLVYKMRTVLRKVIVKS